MLANWYLSVFLVLTLITTITTAGYPSRYRKCRLRIIIRILDVEVCHLSCFCDDFEVFSVAATTRRPLVQSSRRHLSHGLT